MVKSVPRRYFVTAGRGGGWLVYREGHQRAIFRLFQKGNAVETARTMAHENAPSEVIVEKKDGSFALKYSFGPEIAPAF